MELIFGGLLLTMIWFAVKTGFSYGGCVDNGPHKWGKWYTVPGGFLNRRKCETCGYEYTHT